MSSLHSTYNRYYAVTEQSKVQNSNKNHGVIAAEYSLLRDPQTPSSCANAASSSSSSATAVTAAGPPAPPTLISSSVSAGSPLLARTLQRNIENYEDSNWA